MVRSRKFDFAIMTGLLLVLFLQAFTSADTVEQVTHKDFQAVNADGTAAYTSADSDWVILEGIVLNKPEEYLDPTPAYSPLGPIGGQWQIFIQADDPCDYGGTAVWLGQNYGMIKQDPGYSYTDPCFAAELCRINHDPNTGYVFTPGDRVRVTGKFLFYRGKNNINEQHSNDPANDFDIRLITPAFGLPQPELITLADLKNGSDDFIFDPGRQSGCEHYQGRLIRINGISFVDPGNWGPGGELLITDGTRTFPVKLGIGRGISAGSNNLAATFDIIGILDQEGGSFSGGWVGPFDNGYRIVVLNYDGNSLVLCDRDHRRGNLPGDVNGDWRVDLADVAALASDWLVCRTGLCDCD